MSSISATKTTCKQSSVKCLSPGTSNISQDESDLSVRTNDTHINGKSYENTPSPSSIASVSTTDRSAKSPSKGVFHQYMSSKRRYRHDKLFHYTHILNRQYIITMTNILFQMQKEIYKLNRRTRRVEQILANQKKSGHPIIRIPRLTKDEITTICIDDDQTQPTVASSVLQENETNNNSSSMMTDNIQPLNEYTDETESPITAETISQTNIPRTRIHTKYCIQCQKEFSHRSAYLRHMRRKHNAVYPSESTRINSIESDSPRNEKPTLTTDPQEIENEVTNDSLQVLVNQWDIGEGRLRPRRVSKATNIPNKKVKCDICNKFLRVEYIKKHKRRAHGSPKASSSSGSHNIADQIILTVVQSVDNTPATVEKSSSSTFNSPLTNINPLSPNTDPPSGLTIAEMDMDDIPIQFRKESNKPIVIASTCLERYQIEILEEFLQKFSSRVCVSPAVDSRTTHLITNDGRQSLRSPLSMKLIEGIANHCHCLSYRWIIDCLQYDRIMDESPYEIEGDDTQNHANGGPKRSRCAEKRNSLFEHIRFMIKCTEDRDIRMTNDRLQDLIVTCGGQIINCVTQELLNEFEIVILCDRLYVSERRHNYEQCRLLGINFVSSDWVLESILEYRQKPFASYEETP